MSRPVAKLSSLRQLLSERFPRAARGDTRTLPTGVPAIDDGVGGLPCGAVTEIVCAAPSCGSQLLLGELLRVTRHERGRVALVDGHDSFDPASWPGEWLQHLVWVRCCDTAMALHAADILTRDANLQLVVIDLRLAPLAELKRTPAQFWYRLQRSTEPSDLALAVFTPQATVPSARLRLELAQSHDFTALSSDRLQLAAALTPAVQRQRQIAASG
ncbi:hypothetical protein [Opitutus terrae]|uniref:RecA/RadA recombinase-like protein n=1 Tax=Opitutus terrae (strain DSM 11246 / JCM 15787 / PB90-1) TaxID=452637 RepID=B1ZZZ3_OPITP|nr:hypothetical protein [Opitutus terrae]ACB77329.1 hypothetical protein Oter_4055 [Opitutus terrae PB90-1]